MPSSLGILPITLGIVIITFAIISITILGSWAIGAILLAIAILFIFVGALLLSNPLLKFNSQSQTSSSSTSSVNQNSYQNPFKSVNTLSGFTGSRRQGSGVMMLILGIVLLALRSWIVGIIFLYGAYKLLMNPMQLNLQANPPTPSLSGDDQDGFEDEQITPNTIISSYLKS
jgi:hypothetical protein